MRFFVNKVSRWCPASRIIGLIVAILVAMFILGVSARAEVATSVISLPQPTATAAEMPAETGEIPPFDPTQGKLLQDDKREKQKPIEPPKKPKGEYIEWRRGYVSGVSDRIITVVVSTAQRRGSYEPVEITPTTKITRGGRPAVLKEIRIRQYAGVRGYRQGDIVKATEYSIGGFPYARSAVRKRAVIRRKPAVKKKAPARKKTPAKPTGKDSKTLRGKK